MLYVQTARRQVAVAGRVTDAETGRPIAGAQVRITEAPDAFVKQVVIRARNVRFGSPALDVVRPILDDPTTSTWLVLIEAKAILDGIQARTEHRVNAARAILDNPGAGTDYQLAAAQTILDCLQARQMTPLKRLDQTFTAMDGSFYFMDLPNDNYTLAASLPGASSRYQAITEVTVTVSRDEAGTIAMRAFADMSLRPTGLKGTVRDEDNDQVSMVEIRVISSGELTYSSIADANAGRESGEYRLVGLEQGKRSLRISARGFKTKSEPVTLEQGIMLSKDIILIRDAVP